MLPKLSQQELITLTTRCFQPVSHNSPRGDSIKTPPRRSTGNGDDLLFQKQGGRAFKAKVPEAKETAGKNVLLQSSHIELHRVRPSESCSKSTEQGKLCEMQINPPALVPFIAMSTSIAPRNSSHVVSGRRNERRNCCAHGGN